MSGLVLFPTECIGPIIGVCAEVVRVRFGEDVRGRQCESLALVVVGVLRDLRSVGSRCRSDASSARRRERPRIVSDVSGLFMGNGFGAVLVGVRIIAGWRKAAVHLFSVLKAWGNVIL